MNYILHNLQTTIRWHIRRNKNFLIVLTGPPASSKSWTAGRIAESLDKTFGVYRVCFHPYEFLKIINDHLSGKNPLPKGAVIIVDEAGAQYGARSWQSFNNRMLGRLMQSFRSLNLVVLFTVPHFGYFEKQGRELVHIKLEALDKINYQEEKALFKVWKIRMDDWTGKMIPYHPWKLNLDGSITRVKYMWFRKPTEKFIQEYEAKKLNWQTRDYSKQMVYLIKEMVKRGQIGELDDATIAELAETEGVTLENDKVPKKAKAFVFNEEGTVKML